MKLMGLYWIFTRLSQFGKIIIIIIIIIIIMVYSIHVFVKKLVLKHSVLHLGSDIQWLDLRLRPWIVLCWGGEGRHLTFGNKRKEGSHAFSKVLLHKHNLSDRLGMEPLQSAISKIILKARFLTRSSCCLRCVTVHCYSKLGKRTLN